MKKLIILAAASGLALSTAAYADGSSNKKDDMKANKSSTEMHKDQKASGALKGNMGTTGAGSQTTTSDPRDSNANATPKSPAEKSRLDDAKEKP